MRNGFPKIKRILSGRDMIAKIICVLLAVILWAYISSTNIGEIKFKIPVAFINLHEKLMMSRVSNRYVTVTLTSRKDNLKNVNIKSVKAVVNLEQPEVGIIRSYPIEISKDEIPENIDLSLSSKEVNLIVERKIYKKIAVRANLVGKVKDGYVLGKIKIIPDSITINGPESLIKTIDSVQTEKISIANKTERLINDVVIDNKDMPDINIDASKVRVIIPVIESANLSEFRKKIILKNINSRYKYILNQEEINVYLQSDMANVQPSGDDIDVFVDVGSLDLDEFFKEENKDYFEENYSIDFVIKRDGIRLITVFPDAVSVKIMEK